MCITSTVFVTFFNWNTFLCIFYRDFTGQDTGNQLAVQLESAASVHDTENVPAPWQGAI